MKSTPERIKAIAAAFLKEKEIKYVELGEPVFEPAGAKENKLHIDHWVVSYVYMVFQDEEAFIFIADNTEQVLYIMTGHGYLYGAPPGSEGMRRDKEYLDTMDQDDDEDDWDLDEGEDEKEKRKN